MCVKHVGTVMSSMKRAVERNPVFRLPRIAVALSVRADVASNLTLSYKLPLH
jgi:hypothetical protein